MLSRLFTVLLLLGLSLNAVGVVDVYEFGSEVDRERYQAFIEEMRCPKCQNQNLAGSNSPIAADLRREVHRLIEEGKSDREIVDFMVSRYGEFVLYKPQLKQNTWLLWYGPASLLVLGIIVIILILKRRSKAAAAEVATEDATHLSAEEEERLAAILEGQGKAEHDGQEKAPAPAKHSTKDTPL